MTSKSLREAHDAALWKIHRVRTMNGNVYVVAVGDVRDTLDKIRAELHATAEMHSDGDYYLREEWIDEYFDKYRKGLT